MANEEHVKRIKQGARAWNVWRRKNRDVTPDFHFVRLSHADLRERDLRRADFSSADLSRADFRGADLNSADLSRADLSAASLSLTRLGGANLRGANLTGANLSKADLVEANLSGADLTGAVLSEATIGQTVFADNDLSATEELEAVTHSAPSTIGVDTLYKSQGKIPQVFLRGVGLPEGFITYLPSLIAQPIEFYSCFISYSHADKSFARRLHDALQGRGIRCWLDEHQLLPGDKIYTEVDRGIRLWDKVLLCCSKDALTSWWVDNEIKIAFDNSSLGKRPR